MQNNKTDLSKYNNSEYNPGKNAIVPSSKIILPVITLKVDFV